MEKKYEASFLVTKEEGKETKIFMIMIGRESWQWIAYKELREK